VDVHDELDRITHAIEEARAMPMSASALINRAEVLTMLDELREMLPTSLRDAEEVLRDREAVVARAREEAAQVVAAAQAEHDRLVEQSAIMTSARERAAGVQIAAHTESQRLLAQADDYVDRKLGEFEVALDRLSQQVGRGRARLAERRAGEASAAEEASPADEAEAPARDGSLGTELFDAQAPQLGSRSPVR
jgi:hypothetical protein